MDFLDLVIIVAIVGAAVGGFRLGFVGRVVSWIGLAAGLVIAAKVLPTVIGALRNSDPTAKLLVAALVLLGGAFLGQGIGLVAGTHVGRIIPPGPLRGIDDAIGAAVGLVGVLVVVWLLLPSLATVSGWPAIQARNSTVARWIDRDFPAPPNTLEALRHLVGNETFPEVFSALAPAHDTGPPPASSGITAALEKRIELSTVKVEGDACHELQEGSGWAIRPGYILTNAHVVAGEHSTEVRLDNGTGSTLSATVVRFDPNRDLALLAVPGLAAPTLPLTTQPSSVSSQQSLVGLRGAVFGHPGGQDGLAVTPFLVSEYIAASGRNLYDTQDTLRDVFILASNLMPGDSGGPVVNQSGTVVAVAFAIAPDRAGTSYALSYTEVAGFLSGATIKGPVSTGPCLSE